MNVLVIPSWYRNKYRLSFGSFFYEQAVALANAGCNVTLFHLHHYRVSSMFKLNRLQFGLEKRKRNRFEELIFHFPKIPKMKMLNRFFEAAIIKLFFFPAARVRKPNIIHLHSFRAGSMALYLKNKLSIPFITTEHSSFFYREKFSKMDISYAKFIFSASSRNLAVSNSFVYLLKNLFHLKFEYFPNFIDDDFFHTKSARAKHTKTIVNIGFLGPIKNQALLIKSFTRAFMQDERIILKIVGSGSAHDDLSRLIQLLHMENRIFLLGFKEKEEIKNILATADAFALSSEYETFNVAVIEALALGLPVVSTRCGGPESIIVSDKLGILCEQDEASLAHALQACMKTEYDEAYIREYAYNHFSSSVATKKLIEIYQAVVKNDTEDLSSLRQIH